MSILPYIIFFLLNDPATTEIYTLSLHDALPISSLHSALPRQDLRDQVRRLRHDRGAAAPELCAGRRTDEVDRKSTRLNSSHPSISYAVFCLKKKKQTVFTNRVAALLA